MAEGKNYNVESDIRALVAEILETELSWVVKKRNSHSLERERERSFHHKCSHVKVVWSLMCRILGNRNLRCS